MGVFESGEAIREFLRELDGWLTRSVDGYLLGGTAMTAEGLRDRTKDIDLAVAVTTEFNHILETLREHGFSVIDEPTEPFGDIGRSVELAHPGSGVQLDLFERQILGKIWVTSRMQARATEFWTGEYVTASILASEDMFLLKAVSGGDLASNRRRDIDDMRLFAQRGLNYEAIVDEIDRQRPFNTGPTEATHIRNRSHPLFTIETAVEQLVGLPSAFTARLTEFATEFEVEYVVLTAVDDGTHDIETIREQVRSAVRTLSDHDTDETENAIDRLGMKQILTRADDATIRLHPTISGQ